MKILVLLILFIAIIVFTWAGREQEEAFCFTKIADQNKEFVFEYNLENGTKFKGNTTYLFDMFDSHAEMQLYYYLLLNGASVIHWVALSGNDLNSTEQISRTVHPVSRADDSIEFQNDYVRFFLKIDSDMLSIYPYITQWDLQNVCFKKIYVNRNVFHYRISSLNNNRIYEGDTYHEDEDDVLSERIHLNDSGQSDYVIRVDFKNEEIQLNDTFCRGISEIISQYFVLGAAIVSGIDPNALKSLVG